MKKNLLFICYSICLLSSCGQRNNPSNTPSGAEAASPVGEWAGEKIELGAISSDMQEFLQIADKHSGIHATRLTVPTHEKIEEAILWVNTPTGIRSAFRALRLANIGAVKINALFKIESAADRNFKAKADEPILCKVFDENNNEVTQGMADLKNIFCFKKDEEFTLLISEDNKKLTIEEANVTPREFVKIK